ncbi:caspase family protein [Nocardia sp. NPDC051052]|uniref:caspase family protein n=1 Tax=Nocardia sp. NPDC051052 TaxID=3364322 RepID=UPI0037B3A06F
MASTSSGYQRAAVAIGVDRVAPLPGLQAAAAGAETMAEWAALQGCEVSLHTDGGGSAVTRRDILDSVRALVDRRIYDQLIIYFAGHGLLMAPGAEMWLLTDAAADHTEAVNALLTAEYARRAGIPHVVLISDACRTYVNGPPFYGMTGGSIFPPGTPQQRSADLDIYFGTAPGDPAYEIADGARTGYGIFTRCLLDVLDQPPRDIIEYIHPGPNPVFGTAVPSAVPVVTSRALKDPLIEAVTGQTAQIDPLLDQRPEVRTEAVLPQFFATVDINAQRPVPDSGQGRVPVASQITPNKSTGDAPSSKDVLIAGAEADSDRVRGLRELLSFKEVPEERADGYSAFIVVQGTEVRGVTAVGWEIAERTDLRGGFHRVELVPTTAHRPEPTSAVVEFDNSTGTVVALVPEAIAVVAISEGRVTGMNYRTTRRGLDLRPAVPGRYGDLAGLTYAALQGNMATPFEWTEPDRGFLASPPRRLSVPDRMIPEALRAYGAAERGQFPRDALLKAAQDDLISFDLAMLVDRSPDPEAEIDIDDVISSNAAHPFVPMFTRGWLLMENSQLAVPYHRTLSRYLVPALYSTFTVEGVRLAHEALIGRDIT